MASFKLYLALALITIASAAPNSRLVGGNPTTIQQFPYIVSLVYYYPQPQLYIQRCVGSLVTSWHVLTTAYCFTGANLDNMYVRAGSTNSLSGGIIRYIDEVVKHDDYVETPRAGDIAIIVLDNPLGITDSIGVLSIPGQNTFIPDNTEVKVVSWGFESQSGPQLEILKTINLYKLPLADCQADFQDSTAVSIEDPVLCAAAPERSMCLGDSGAPMVIGDVLIGLSSYYENCDDSKPDVFTRIDRYTNWIVEVASRPRTSAKIRISKILY
ncbi:trypsin, alkaline B-like [Aphomia sociella]